MLLLQPLSSPDDYDYCHIQRHALLISRELYRKAICPIHQKIINLAANYNLPIMILTCGSSNWANEDFIEMGVKVVYTLQPEAANMSPAYLKSGFYN